MVMSSPPVPPSLEQLGGRPFSFYPAILNIEHNEWAFRRATWAEVLVLNTKSQMELWVPRRFLGEISSIDEPVMIVGLNKELEYKAGSVLPHQRRIIEMPRAVNDIPRPPAAPEPPSAAASVVGIRLEGGAESKVGRMILTAMAIGIVAAVVALIILRDATMADHVSYTTVEQTDLGLTTHDDYYSVVSKLGTPAGDRWRSDRGELQYRALSYPKRGFDVILMGTERNATHYIGAMDKNWKIVHSVPLPGGRDSSAILKGLKRF